MSTKDIQQQLKSFSRYSYVFSIMFFIMAGIFLGLSQLTENLDKGFWLSLGASGFALSQGWFYGKVKVVRRSK